MSITYGNIRNLSKYYTEDVTRLEKQLDYLTTIYMRKCDDMEIHENALDKALDKIAELENEIKRLKGTDVHVESDTQ